MDRIQTALLAMAAQNSVPLWDNTIHFSDYQMKYKTLNQVKEKLVKAVKAYFVWNKYRSLYINQLFLSVPA